jgi:hypothetical protein
MNNINVTIRINKQRVEELKKIARRRSLKEKKDITYNELITQSVYDKYFKKQKSE